MHNVNVAVILVGQRHIVEHAGEKKQKEDRMALTFC